MFPTPFWNSYYPFIDYSTGGSIDGMIRATEANLTKVTDKMIVIPGHGPVGDKAQLTFYRDLLVTVRDRVATLKKQGRTLDEIVAAKCSPDVFSRAFNPSVGGRRCAKIPSLKIG